MLNARRAKKVALNQGEWGMAPWIHYCRLSVISQGGGEYYFYFSKGYVSKILA